MPWKASLTPSSRTKISMGCWRCGGRRRNPPSVVPPLALALVTRKFGPSGRNFSTSSIGQASRGLRARPSDKLSPKTKMVFICDGSAAGAPPTCPQKNENKTAATTLLRHCFGRFRILLSALTRFRHSRKSRNLKIFYYYGKLRYQRLRAHRTQRSSRHVTKRRQTRSRDQRSYRYPHARAFTEMGFGPWEIRWRDQLRRAEHYRARSQDSDSQGT